MMSAKSVFFSFLVLFSTHVNIALGQACTTLGQTPSTAFPVCGTTTFKQDNVPLCNTNSLYVPGCSGNGNANYENKNPFWYKFTCYVSGSLGFVITPNDLGDDYDWQLYDVTGLNTDDVFTNQNIIVSGNWSGSSGLTGASATGVAFIQCASNPAVEVKPTFAKMPDLIAGHEYILLVSHYTDSQSGYSLSFGGGTAVITDPAEPHLQKASPSCDGAKITVKLNKKMKCSSLTATGSEFSLSPGLATIVSAVATNCSTSFDFDEVTLTLSAPLPSSNYQLIIDKGSDANSLLDNCERAIPTEQTDFSYIIPQPIPIDSVGRTGCAPIAIKLYFSKKIDCSSIAANGSNFLVTGPTAVNVVAASGDCTNGLSDIITVRFDKPISTKGLYTVTPKLSVNGGAVRDECGKIIQPLPVSFTAADTVSSLYTYTNDMGCRFDTMLFSHNGANDVNKWEWAFNNTDTFTTSSHSIIFPASSTNTVQLIVSNGVCSDTTKSTIVLDNEVIVDFKMPDVICPEDPFIVENLSTGLIDSWQWNFDILNNSHLKTPLPFLFPANSIESFYTIKLVATNSTIGCSDSLSKRLKVLDNCFIAVPTAFTPNGDGLNDLLYPNNAIKADNLEFKVFNRWGQLVFSSRNWQEKWNGKIKGIEQGTDVFVWFLNYTHRDTGKKVFQKGTTMLIR
ncbi:MAG: gliding motility-associated C-terminal domain-containing protein [Chitinophagaceae bacterium]